MSETPSKLVDLTDSDNEEEQLRRAIALSLLDPVPTERSVTEDASESEDADLRAAIALSLQDSSVASQGHNLETSTINLATPPADQKEHLVAFGSMTLDRKRMEEERLRRMKRKAPDYLDGHRESQKFRTGAPSTQANPSAPLQSHGFQTNSSLEYPKGVIKKTWARGYTRNGSDITIEEILRKEELQLAVLSSFMWDDEWLVGKIDMSRTKVLLITYAASEQQKEQNRSNAPSPLVKFCFPPMGRQGIGAMHSKLQLLKFKSHLRIVIPTGNLTRYDWGETGVLENMVYLIDLPRLIANQTFIETLFHTELKRFLTASGIDESLVQSLERYNFSETASQAFVHTIPGSHVGNASQSTGICGLNAAVRSLGLATSETPDIDYVCSSLGSLRLDFIAKIINACQGSTALVTSEAQFAKGKIASDSPMQSSTIKEKFRIYFPSDATVQNSRGGRDAAGTICVQKKWWDSATFPKDLIRDSISKRSGLLMHTKIMFVQVKGGGGDILSWVYLGSANLSESAWGQLSRDRSSGQAKLTCRNWECGVLLPISRDAGESGVAITSLEDVFGETVPVPMVNPAPAYGCQADGREPAALPWLFREA